MSAYIERAYTHPIAPPNYACNQVRDVKLVVKPAYRRE